MQNINNKQAQDLMRDVIRRVAVGPDRGRDILLQEAEDVVNKIDGHKEEPSEPEDNSFRATEGE